MKRLRMVALAVVVVLLCWALFGWSRHPVALIRVVDGTGKPVQGAVVKPDGMRTKQGPYVSGHYGWERGTDGPPATQRTTDADGEAWVPYPKFVFEKIETGQISFSVRHPEFVPDRPFRVVTTAPPAGAPLSEWGNYLLDRVKHRVLVAHTEPVVLQRGAILKLQLAGRVEGTNRVYAQISGPSGDQDDFWTNPAAGLVMSRQVQSGPHLARIIRFDDDGTPLFSDVVSVTADTNQATELQLEVSRGVNISGKIDPAIPRPIKRGRVIVHVTPPDALAKDDPPQWHTWSVTDEEGNFRFDSLPPGLAEISAICDGFISTNGPGQFSSTRYPQRYEIGTNNLSIMIGMERTARLEVTILDAKGEAVRDAKVVTWPNIRYGDWGSMIFGSDCYQTADSLRKPVRSEFRWSAPVPDFEAESDANGVAVLANLPATVDAFSVRHPALHLPAVSDNSGQKRREAIIKLLVTETNRVIVRLEPSETSQIAHY